MLKMCQVMEVVRYHHHHEVGGMGGVVELFSCGSNSVCLYIMICYSMVLLRVLFYHFGLRWTWRGCCAICAVPATPTTLYCDLVACCGVCRVTYYGMFLRAPCHLFSHSPSWPAGRWILFLPAHYSAMP